MRDVASSPGIAESCLHHWKRRDLIDWGLASPALAAIKSAALAQARARITELENEIKTLHGQTGVPRAGGSRSGYYDSSRRDPSARAIRQGWPTDQIAAVHQASRQT
ncbi:hypothetical protein GCM10009550_76510 [Actinocorallia libanotica]|uniref:Transposase n=1 Tax=Actinocorallia libanotica TaxID=46162 RepID=A0ABN1S0W7_9ACTN